MMDRTQPSYVTKINCYLMTSHLVGGHLHYFVVLLYIARRGVFVCFFLSGLLDYYSSDVMKPAASRRHAVARGLICRRLFRLV